MRSERMRSHWVDPADRPATARGPDPAAQMRTLITVQRRWAPDPVEVAPIPPADPDGRPADSRSGRHEGTTARAGRVDEYDRVACRPGPVHGRRKSRPRPHRLSNSPPWRSSAGYHPRPGGHGRPRPRPLWRAPAGLYPAIRAAGNAPTEAQATPW